MDNAEAINKLKKYKKLLSNHMKFKEMILFGSYAKGTAHKDSDLDVAIVVDELKGDFFPPDHYCGSSEDKLMTGLSRLSLNRTMMTADFYLK